MVELLFKDNFSGDRIICPWSRQKNVSKVNVWKETQFPVETIYHRDLHIFKGWHRKQIFIDHIKTCLHICIEGWWKAFVALWQKAQSFCWRSCRCKENSYPGCVCCQQALSGAQTFFISCVFDEQRKTLLVSLVVAKFFNQKNTACIIGRFDQKNSASIISRSFQARKLSCTSACWWTSNLDPVQRKSWLVSLIFEDNFDCSQFSGLSAHWRIASLPVTAPPGSFWGYFMSWRKMIHWCERKYERSPGGHKFSDLNCYWIGGAIMVGNERNVRNIT